MSAGPLPSVRCLLSGLCQQQIGAKVRFLGCVTAYSTRSAQITLRHDYPKTEIHTEAVVDVKLILETLNSEQTDIGQWIHVIGYLTFVEAVITDSQSPSGSKPTPRAGVQALLLWVAQDLDLSAYERSLSQGIQ
ncbi:CST complex subunit Ten1 [Poronia punctata]|nr:CST complex subunit Ten1 [Poronia punctata]